MKEIHSAARDGYIGLVKSLLGRDPKKVNDKDEGWTPLHFASREGQMEMVRLLIEHGADVNAQIDTYQNYSGTTSLHLAAAYGHKSVVELLLANGADINRRDGEGNTALHRALGIKTCDDVVELLITSGADVNARNEAGETPLHTAVDWCHIKSTDLLLEKRVDVNVKDTRGITPLYMASVFSVAQAVGDELAQLVTNLISNGADVNARTLTDYGGIPAGTTPLGGALHKNRARVAELLKQHGGVV